MKIAVAVALFALALTTGFTCSKNTPTEATPESAPAAQEQMAAPTAPEAAPAEAPAEAPAGENK